MIKHTHSGSSSTNQRLDSVKLDPNNLDRCNELLQENLTIESRLKDEIELKDKECNALKFEFQELQKQCAMAERITFSLRKTLVQKQMDMENVTLEIKKQEDLIESKSSANTPDYYVESVSLVSQTVEHVKKLEIQTNKLLKQFKERNQLIDEKMKFLSGLLATVQSLQNAEIQVKSEEKLKSAHLRMSEEVLNLEDNVNLLDDEFKKCKLLKDKFGELLIKKESIDAEHEGITKECHELKETLVLIKAKHENIQMNFEKEGNAIELLAQTMDTDATVMLQKFEEEIETLSHQFQTLESIRINLNQDVLNLEIRESFLNDSIKNILNCIQDLDGRVGKTSEELNKCSQKRMNDENTLHILKDQLSEIQSRIPRSQHLKVTLENNITHLIVEAKKFLAETESDKLEEFNIIFQKKQAELSEISKHVACMKSELNRVKLEINQLTFEKNLREHQSLRFEKLVNELKIVVESKEIEATNKLSKQIKDINEQMFTYQHEIEYIVAESFENQLLNDELSRDLEAVEEKPISAHFDLWSSSKENEDYMEQLLQLSKKLHDEQNGLDMTKKLYADLKKNSIPINQIPDHWYQSFEKLKNEYESAIQARTELKKKHIHIEQMNNDSSLIESELQLKSVSNFGTLKPSDLKEKRKLRYELFKQRIKKQAS